MNNSDTQLLALQFGATGDELCRQGAFRDARHMYERQADCVEWVHGKDSVEVVPVLLNASDACRSYGRTPKADEYWTRSLNILRTNLGVDSSDEDVLEAYVKSLQARNETSLAVQMAVRLKTLRCQRG